MNDANAHVRRRSGKSALLFYCLHRRFCLFVFRQELGCACLVLFDAAGVAGSMAQLMLVHNEVGDFRDVTDEEKLRELGLRDRWVQP